MKYYIIAGEASGDLHGSNLLKAIRSQDQDADFRCWGGDKMRDAGAALVKHYRELAFMGFTEVIMNLRTILNNLSFCKKDITQYAPDVLILVDYPGFNLRIAKWAKAAGYKVVYYISPQVWAWKENRVKTIRECVDLMLVILPFEKPFYQKWKYRVYYVGHPLMEVVEAYRAGGEVLQVPEAKGKPIIALLPGSRKQEIIKKLPVMLEVSRRFPNHHFVVAQAPGLEPSFYQSLMQPFPNVSAVSGQTYALLSAASAALVTSGTATLETALFRVPEIICYKGNPISYYIARKLITIRFIGLVNLIMDKEVVKELIQHDLTVDKLSMELNRLLDDPIRKEELSRDYAELSRILSMGGHASNNAAKLIASFLNGENLSE